MPLTFEVDSNSESGSEDEVQETLGSKVQPLASKAAKSALALGLVALINLGVLAALRGPLADGAAGGGAGGGAGLMGPLTVNGLLQGSELTDLATDNLMAMSQGALDTIGRSQVRAHVARSLQEVGDGIREAYPEDHAQLDSLELSKAQKDRVLRVLQTYGDARMVSFTGAIQDAAAETAAAHGDQMQLKRRLSEKLAPHFGDMRQLAQEMFPGAADQFAVDLDGLHVVHKWHPELEVDFADSSEPAASLRSRRLSAAALAGVDGSVRAQASTLFQSLQHELGERMPKAPVRMLAEATTKDDKSLMNCLSTAVSKASPTAVCHCLADNIQDVIGMMMQFVKGKSP